MAVPTRSWAILLLALLFSVGPATAALAQATPAPGGCGVGATPATPANPTPGVPGATPATPAIPADPAKCAPGRDGVLGTADDVPLVLGSGFGPDGVQGTDDDLPLRADTGAGGTAGGGSPVALLLLGGGLLALGAAFGVRRAAHGRPA